MTHRHTFARVVILSVLLLSFAQIGATARSEHYCVSEDGVLIEQQGTATCDSGAGAIAKVYGRNSHATAVGSETTVTVIGNNSSAYAEREGNTVIVEGDRSFGTVVTGNDNSVHVSGNDSRALAGGGHGNTVSVHGNKSEACAIDMSSVTVAVVGNRLSSGCP